MVTERSSARTRRLLARIERAEDHIHQVAVRQGATGLFDIDLTINQLRLLSLLAASGPRSSHELAEALGLGATALTGIVDRLEVRSYVRRVPDDKDRRVRHVELTDKAIAELRELDTIKRTRFRSVLRRMAPDDLERLADGIDALAIAFAAEFGEPDPARGT